MYFEGAGRLAMDASSVILSEASLRAQSKDLAGPPRVKAR